MWQQQWLITVYMPLLGSPCCRKACKISLQASILILKNISNTFTNPLQHGGLGWVCFLSLLNCLLSVSWETRNAGLGTSLWRLLYCVCLGMLPRSSRAWYRDWYGFFFFFFYPKQHNPEQMVRVAPARTRVERDPNERCVSCDKLDWNNLA